MMRSATTVVLIALLAGAAAPGDRSDYPQDYFRSPIGIPILLSGSFAELRSNHFHSGLDIKTNGKPGYRVYAAADGNVVRVKVSPYGFGNALYVRHPNGFTTVYAHLRNFNDEIQDWVRKQQYRAERFDVDLFPDASLFPVSKGEVIAISGNSGGSSGAHLHFEIRDTATEWPVNPLLFGLDVRDDQPPQIRKIKIYAMDDASMASITFANGRSQDVTYGKPALIQAVGTGRSFELQGVRSVSAIGQLGFGIETRDYMNGSSSRLGPYKVILLADENPVFEYTAEKFSFSNTRYINAHVDYSERQNYKRWVQRSFLLPGNRLPSYQNVVNNGAIAFLPGVEKTIRYEVVDTPGNGTSLSFRIRGDASLVPPKSADQEGELVGYLSAASIVRDGFRAEIPEGTLYEDTWFRYSAGDRRSGGYSKSYILQDPETPLHKHVRIAIRGDELPPRLRSQAALAYRDEEGKVSLQSAEYSDGWVSARTRTLGEFFVSADTVEPRIRPINISDGKSFARSYNIRFKIWDSETGVDSYRGTVDGKWVLFEYDAKSRMLVHTFDGTVGRGSHVLRLEVTDGVGNRKTYESRFSR